MNALTKSYARSTAIISTARTMALQAKGGGGFVSRMSPAITSSPSDWQQQSRNRESYAMYRSWVYAAVNALATEASSQPVTISRLKGSQVKGKGEGKRQRPKGSKSLALQKMTKSIRHKAEDGDVELLTDHPLADILEKPNEYQFRAQFVQTFVCNLNLTGRAYIIKDEDKEGNPTYFSVPTTWVRVDRSEWPKTKYFVANPRNIDFMTGEPLDESQVACAYFPNPADPLGAISPASSQSAAIRVDDRIQVCQEKFFDNGVFPSAVVIVGKDPHPDVPGGMRPRLTGTQRRQITGAIRRTLASPANYGNVAIVDGLVENIIPFGRTQNELGWDRSEDKLKTRILSAFCVHPYILGETVGVGGYAQTYVIEKRFCKRINIFLDMLSTLMTEFVGRGQEEGAEKLLVWWEEAKADDPSLRWQNLKYARDKGDLSPNELRAELGYPPSESQNEAVLTSGAITSAVIALQTAVGQGQVSKPMGKATLIAMGIPEEQAAAIVGEDEPDLAPPAPPGQPPPMDPLAAATGELQKAIASLRMDPDQLAAVLLEDLR